MCTLAALASMNKSVAGLRGSAVCALLAQVRMNTIVYLTTPHTVTDLLNTVCIDQLLHHPAVLPKCHTSEWHISLVDPVLALLGDLSKLIYRVSRSNASMWVCAPLANASPIFVCEMLFSVNVCQIPRTRFVHWEQ